MSFPACEASKSKVSPLEHDGTTGEIENKQKRSDTRTDGITAFQALANLVKAIVGTGVFSLPLAFKNGGLVGGFVLIIAFGWISYYSCKKIVECSQHLARNKGLKCLDYGRMAEESFKQSFKPIRPLALPMRYFVNLCILIMQVGICSAYISFIKEHLHEIVRYQFPDINISNAVFYLITTSFICVLVLTRNLRVISTVSLIGNVFMTIILTIVIQEVLRMPTTEEILPNFHGVGSTAVAAGAVLYALEGQAMVLPLENKMNNPQKMYGIFGVLSLGNTVITLIYAAVGFCGYIAFGSSVQGAITLNLPDTPLYFWVKILMVLAVFSSYLIQQYAIVHTAFPTVKGWIEDRGCGSFVTDYLAEALFKIFWVLFASFLAAAMKDLGSIISLTGIVGGMSLALIIPGTVHITTFLPTWLEEKNQKAIVFHMFWNILFLIAGVFFLVLGVVENVRNIINAQ